MNDWHLKKASEVAAALGTDPSSGLGSDEARKRLAQYGPNELTEKGVKSPWRILWEQITGVMVVILIIAAVVSFFLGEFKDATAIMAIVVLNAILGVRQEYKAEKAMAALKKLAAPVVRVRRGGEVIAIASRELVPGDVILVEAGSHVPADCRAIEAANLRVEEAALTGESEPADKNTASLAGADLPLGDRRNMLFLGTTVVYGRGVCLVTGTGMDTEIGRIAGMIQSVERTATPLQLRLDHLGKVLAVVALFLVGIIFCLGLWREGTDNLRQIFLTAISMAVAAVPEGLPAVVTIALALGAQRMLTRKALIRKLLAVETLGSVTVICSDKTGTLTENRMTVQAVVAGGVRTAAPGSAGAGNPATDPALAFTLAGGALCNDAELKHQREGVEVEAVGDPTETALVVAATHAGLSKPDLEKAMPRTAEAPFDADRKRMSTVHAVNTATIPAWFGRMEPTLAAIVFTKGSVDGLLEITDRIWMDGVVRPMDASLRERVQHVRGGSPRAARPRLPVSLRPRVVLPPAEAVIARRGIRIARGRPAGDPHRVVEARRRGRDLPW